MDWVEDSFIQLVKSPVWSYHVDTFIDEHCLIFDADEENKLPYTEVHMNYKKMIEDMLNQYASDFGISFAQLHEACSSGVAMKHKDAFRYIMAVDDFILFKCIMVTRNIQLNNKADTAAATKQSNFPEKTKLESSLVAENSIEDKILEEVLKRSIIEQKQEIEDKSFEKLLFMTLQESLKTECEAKPEIQTKSKIKENITQQINTPLPGKHVKTQEPSAELEHNTFSVKTREKCSTEPPKGEGKSLLRQETGSEAAANQWIVSALEEAGTTTTLPTSSEQQQKILCELQQKDTTKEREIYLKERRDMIISMKKQERTDRLEMCKKSKPDN